jgi:hypothetical protein
MGGRVKLLASHLATALLVVGSVTQSASAWDIEDDWVEHRLDIDAYFQGEVNFVPPGTPGSLHFMAVYTADLGGCPDIHEQIEELLPRVLPIPDVAEAQRRWGGYRAISLRCLAESTGSKFVVVDAKSIMHHARDFSWEHRVRAFRLHDLHSGNRAVAVANVETSTWSDSPDWRIDLTTREGVATGVVLAAEQWADDDAVDVARPVANGLPEDAVAQIEGGMRDTWRGRLLDVQRIGTNREAGVLLLSADDQRIPNLEVLEVTPDGELAGLLSSRDFGAEDDRVAREPTYLRANLALLDWFDSVARPGDGECPRLDKRWQGFVGDLRNRMKRQLAEYETPSRDPLVDEFAHWWDIGLSRAASPLTCEPWTSAKAHPRSSWRAAFGKDRWVAVSRSDRVYTSLEGLEWNEIGPPWPGPAHDVAFGGGLFRLVGDEGRIWSSADGINWDPEHAGTASALLAITWTGSQWIAVGDDGVVVSTSDGLNWELGHIASGPALLDIVVDGGLVVVVGRLGPRGVVASRAADRHWHTITLPRPLVRVHSHCGKLIAFDDEHQPWTSLDGIEWRAGSADDSLIVSELEDPNRTYVLAADGRLGSINRHTGRRSFFTTAPGSRDEPRLFSETVEGRSGGIAIVRGEREDWAPIFSFDVERYHQWKQCTFTPKPRVQFEKFVEFAARFVASDRRQGLGWSEDGMHWRWSRPEPEFSRALAEIRIAGPLLFAWPCETTPLCVSGDGRSWSPCDIDLGRRPDVVDVTWTGDRWLLVSGNQSMFESVDGITWTPSSAVPKLPRVSQAVSQLGGVPIIATYFADVFAFARPDGSGAWCPDFTLHERANLDWDLASVPDGAVLAANRWSRVLVTTDGTTWQQLLPEIDRARWRESFDFQQAIPRPDGVDLFALSDGRLMKSECRWR